MTYYEEVAQRALAMTPEQVRAKDAQAVKGQGCPFCGKPAGVACVVAIYAGARGVSLPGFAHMGRRIAQMIADDNQDLLGEEPPGVEDLL